MTLMKSLLDEIERNLYLLREYINIGAPGMMGASMIRLDIQLAKKSIEENDVAKMLRSFEKLKNNK